MYINNMHIILYNVIIMYRNINHSIMIKREYITLLYRMCSLWHTTFQFLVSVTKRATFFVYGPRNLLILLPFLILIPENISRLYWIEIRLRSR